MHRAVLAAVLASVTACGKPPAAPAFDFEGGDLQGWTVVSGDLARQPTASRRASFHAHGEYFLGSAESGDAYDDRRMGVMRSAPFVVETDYIVLRVGGGDRPRTAYVALRRVSDGRRLRRATGFNDETMRTVVWDVSELAGETCVLQLVDAARDPWGHVNLDYVRFVDE